MAGKRKYDVQGGYTKRRIMPSGLILKYNKAPARFGSYRYSRKYGVGRGGKSTIVKGAIAPYGGRKELKYVDIAAATYVADTTGTVTALNLIAVGDDNINRDGRQVTMKSVQIRGMCRNFDASSGPTFCRMLLVWDNAVNSGAIATVAQILSAVNSVSFPLIDNANRFTILVDRSYALGNFDTTATQSVAQGMGPFVCEIYKKLNVVTQFSGTTAAIGSIQNGGLLMVTIGNSAAGAGGLFEVATRVRFTDE